MFLWLGFGQQALLRIIIATNIVTVVTIQFWGHGLGQEGLVAEGINDGFGHNTAALNISPTTLHITGLYNSKRHFVTHPSLSFSTIIWFLFLGKRFSRAMYDHKVQNDVRIGSLMDVAICDVSRTHCSIRSVYL